MPLNARQFLDANEELLEKAVSPDDAINRADFFSGGQLDAKRQRKFNVMVRKYSKLLGMIRFRRMTQITETIDKMNIGEPVTVFYDNTASSAIAEGSEAEFNVVPKFNQVSLTAKKGRSSWAIPTEALQDNIEQSQFENTVMEAISQRVAHDLEDAVINADSSLSGTTKKDLLLRVFDGLSILLDKAHVLDLAGGPLTRRVFNEAYKMLPKHFRPNKSRLRWFMSDTLAIDWIDHLQERATSVGDSALGGTAVAPLGIPIAEVPLMPDTEAIDPGTATPAVLVGENYGPFAFKGSSNYTFDLNIGSPNLLSGTGATITFTAGTTKYTSEVVDTINTVIEANSTLKGEVKAYARDDGRIKIQTTDTGAPATGTNSKITLTNGGGSSGSPTDALTILGFSTTTDSGAASGGDVAEGAGIWLTDPNNLIWGLLDGTRIYSRFDMDTDQILSVIYNQLALAVENVSYAVKIKNVRVRSL